MLKQELENSRQKFTFAEWLIMPFEAMFYDSRTKTGSLDMETYSWIKMIETLAKNVETTPYTDETNEYDSLVLKMFIEKETGIRIVLHPGEESLEEILPSGAIESLQQDFMDELSDHTNQGPIMIPINRSAAYINNLFDLRIISQNFGNLKSCM